MNIEYAHYYFLGKILYDIQPWLPRHFYEAGVFAAKMDNSLKSFEHPAYEGRNNIWYLNSIPQVKNFLHAVQDETRRKMCKDIFDAFEKEVLGKTDQLEVGIIHGDFNEQNILVRQMKSDPDQWEIFRYLFVFPRIPYPIFRINKKFFIKSDCGF